MRVTIYDEHCGWSPSLNSSKGTGGTEVHITQIATWLAAHGYDVDAYCHTGLGAEQRVVYHDSRDIRPYGPAGLDAFLDTFKYRYDYTLMPSCTSVVSDVKRHPGAP